nr:NADH dehydrogenase subunit 6 [Phryganistria guangxiensis]
MMMIMNAFINLMFMLTKHPLSMGITIVIQTTLIAMMTGLMYKSFWFSYILFLMFIGGMMVLFIYMTSLMPNMMFSLKMKQILLIMMVSMLTLLMIEKKINMMNMDMINLKNNLILMKMYTSPINVMTILLASYLLFTMITVFKITELNKGPLRMTFN